MERHYGMDWLRIGAFGLLILYHIGMVFVPWGFQVKTAHPLAWTEIPMLLTNPWRLTLLFVVSGYASRALYAKSPGIRAFLRNRNARLLLPVLFGMTVVVPPQTWVELVTQHGYADGYLHFWTRDYFRFGTLFGIVMPTWNHLWFVVYLWVYTQVLALLMMMPGSGRLQAAFDGVFGGIGALAVPLGFLLVTQYWLFHRNEDTHALVDDWVAHLQYFPAFLFGFGLAGSRAAMAGLARQWKLSAALAMASYAIIAALLVVYPDFGWDDHRITTVFRLAREVETWTAIAALIGVAERFWNRDHRWRATLAEATFPFYIIHQTVIVVVEYWLLPTGIGPLGEFLVLVPATVAGCWAFYLIGREVPVLRPLIGLKYRVARRAGPVSDTPLWLRRDRARSDLG